MLQEDRRSSDCAADFYGSACARAIAHPRTGQAPVATQPAVGKDHVQRSAPYHGQELDMHPLPALG